MTHFQFPTIRGTIEQQLKQIVNYLNDQAEKLNYNVDNSTAESIFREAAKAVSSDVDNTDSRYYDNRYAALKSLIITTATEVKKTQDEKTLTLNGEYLAKSEFGTYFEKATVTIEGNPYGITQLYNYATDIKTVADETKTGFEEYKTNTRNFINMGYLDTSESSPVFGIEVGLLSDTFTVKDEDGNVQTIRNTTPHKIRITPDEISFISNGTVRASISENEVSFPIAKITGGTIDISSGMFSVTNEGFLTSKSGNIGGWTIKSNIIEKDNTSVTDDNGNTGYRVGMQSYSASPSEAAFFAGCSTASGGSIANRSISKFYVTHGGFLYAQDAEITGKITATSLELKDCKLPYDSLKDAPDLTVYITKSGEIKRGTVKKGTNGLTISSDGLLQASNAVIYGKILASEGEIGGWEIKGSIIEKDNTSVTDNNGNPGYRVGMQSYSASPSAAAFFAGCSTASGGSIANRSSSKFYVTHGGFLYAQNAEITGKITATSLELKDCKLSYGSLKDTPDLTVYITNTGEIKRGTVKKGTNGITISSDGLLQASNAVIYGKILASEGEIGGWEIREKRIASANNDGTYSIVQSTGSTFLATGLPSSGSTDTSNTKFIVYHSGKLVATGAEITGKIIANSGTIGKFTVDDTYKYMITTGYSTFGGDGCLYFNPTGSTSSKQIGGSNKIDGWVITAGSNFGVTKSGNLYATNVNLTGTISATSGYIGGWEIREKRIASANNDGTYSIVQSTGSTFLATGLPSSGSTDTSNTKFIVYHSGKLVATGAEITGKITANSGTIGKFTVDDTYKYMITTGYSTFGGDGCLYFNPSGSLSSKQIGGSDKRDGWVITAGSKFGVDKNGYVFCDGAQMNKASFTGIAAFSGAAAFVGNVTLAGNYIYCSHSTAFAWSNNSAGTNIWASVGTINNKTAMYLGVPTWTLRLNASAVQLKDATAVTSDERLKTDIRYFDERHVDFFNRLIPRTFKYIEGTSDRTHFGFIAQEMLNAIEQSGMSTKDTAAFVSVESARDGFEGEEFAIRYGEIVALNTYMIQKLIAQNNELLDEITQLKNEISILKNERNV